MSATLEISIGPVQGFVAQARRTRDLWAGSFLLAFLAGHAMQGARRNCRGMKRPAASVLDKDPLYRWIEGKRDGEEPPNIGALPNHFVADCGSLEQARAAAANAKNAFDAAWQRVCDAVWKQYVAPVQELSSGAREIWNRQTQHFWEFSWAASEGAARGLLARRKHWRTHHPPVEPGDKCQIIPDLQELSGYACYRAGEKQKKFWAELRDRGKLGRLDIEKNERLCAIALIKRLMPKLAEQAVGWKLEVDHWPSTDYVAAVPWLRRAVQEAPEESRKYAEHVCKLGKTTTVGHRKSFRNLGDHPLAALNPDWYDLGSLANTGSTEIKDQYKAEDTELGLVKKLQEEARELFKLTGPPSSYYAVLLADGDRLGQLVGESSGEIVSQALAEFSCGAETAVKKKDGVVVYAGGDDLLAFLPLESALECADRVAQVFTASFEEKACERKVSLSAAVVFAHVKAPLSSVLRRAHRLLDDYAKDGNGRNSLAAAVFGRADERCRWVTCWQRTDADNGGKDRAVKQIQTLKKQLAKGRENGAGALSSSLVYRLRGMISRFSDTVWKPGAEIALPPGMELEPFVRAEAAHSLSKQNDDGRTDNAERFAKSFYAVVRPARGDKCDEPAGITLDAWFLAHFLAGGGREAEHS